MISKRPSRIRSCKWCKDPVLGRADKIFCSVDCKSSYHQKLKKVTQKATLTTDKILHRNRSILLELMGKNAKQKTLPLIQLERKKFNFNYCTGIYENAQGKRYYNLYDFAYMKFSDGRVLIIRRNI